MYDNHSGVAIHSHYDSVEFGDWRFELIGTWKHQGMSKTCWAVEYYVMVLF